MSLSNIIQAPGDCGLFTEGDEFVLNPGKCESFFMFCFGYFEGSESKGFSMF